MLFPFLATLKLFSRRYIRNGFVEFTFFLYLITFCFLVVNDKSQKERIEKLENAMTHLQLQHHKVRRKMDGIEKTKEVSEVSEKQKINGFRETDDEQDVDKAAEEQNIDLNWVKKSEEKQAIDDYDVAKEERRNGLGRKTDEEINDSIQLLDNNNNNNNNDIQSFDVAKVVGNTQCASGLTGMPVRGYQEVFQPFGSLCRSCSSCAIVISSGHLVNSSAGNQIDSHDCVFRSNFSPTKHFEDDVGSKTTFRVIGHVNFVSKDQPSSQPNPDFFVNWGIKRNKNKRAAANYVKFCKELKGRCFSGEDFTEIEASRDFEEASGVKAAWISTGFFTTLIAKQICQRTTFFGITPDDYCTSDAYNRRNVPFHYYKVGIPDESEDECRYIRKQEQMADKLEGHHFRLERKIYRKWKEKNNFSFLHPSWKN